MSAAAAADIRARTTFVGLVAAALYWAGLFLGGALVGLAAETRKRALLAGAGFGVLVWVVFAVTLLAQYRVELTCICRAGGASGAEP